jgi:transcriptional regulator with XRE-family HTH domain
MTDPKRIKDVQDAGWLVQAVGDSFCVARCPTAGCSMRALIADGKDIPQRVVERGPSIDIPVGGYDALRRVLRERRRELLLTIKETEIASGIAEDHMAKFERDEWNRQPNVDAMVEWAASLGFEVVLRPVELPPITLRMIAESRDRVAPRQKRFDLERERDGRPFVRDGRQVDRSGR